jgi:glycosyltransferase involved in cell wall biosynthesis
MVCVIFLRSNPVAPDPRIEKEAKALFNNGYSVLALAWDRTGSLPRTETRGYVVIQRIMISARFGSGFKNILNLLKWNVQLFFSLFINRKKFQVIHACDFDTIIPALIIKFIFKKKVVYDIFDFYADSRSNLPVFLREFSRKVEIWVIGKVDAVILADESRKVQISGSHPKKIEFIYNSPEKITYFINKPNESYRLQLTYVGILVKERGLLEMFQILEKHPEWRLNIAGFGKDEDLIKNNAKRLPNVVFHGKVSYEKAIELSSEADVLFATYDPSISNHRYSSPNKLFEAMMLGKPIIVCKGTGMDNIVLRFGLGFVVNYGDIGQLENVLSEISSWNREFKKQFEAKAKSVYENYFSWEIMSKRLINLYKEIV